LCSYFTEFEETKLIFQTFYSGVQALSRKVMDGK